MAKKKKHKRLKTLGRRVMQSLDLPEEALGGLPKVTLLGRENMLVENHQGIFEYAADRIRLITTEGILCIGGEELRMKELSVERLYISGRIDTAGYET